MHHLLLSALNFAGGAPSLQRQLLDRLRQAILDGRLTPGSRLPSSRALCEELRVSRNTVLAVYEQLIAEGYARADRQGTRVAQGTAPARSAPLPAAAAPRASRRVATMTPARDAGDRSLPLTPGMPALARFPVNAWLRAQERALRAASPLVLGYGDPLGEPALREAIAHYLALPRGVRCDASRIVITEGAQGALSLCVRLFANAGEVAWMEDPGYGGARAAFLAGDLKVVGMPVDAEGIAVPARAWRARAPRLIHVTPSHQYPCGAVLSLARRLELIAQARSRGSWIIEDDYDSDFRHRGHPVAAMQGLVADAPVLYVGTFSKTMFPALRIGFLVLPASSAGNAAAALGELLRGGHRLEQLALAEFIASGQFSRHLGRMRRLYRERQQALRAALASCFAVEHEVLGGDAGLHLTVRLPDVFDDRAISVMARANGLNVGALSSFAAPASTSMANGLVLGYGNTSAEQFAPLMRRLARIVLASRR